MKILDKKISELVFAEYNPRQLSKEQFQQIKDSIARFGIVDPIIVNSNKDRKNIIIGGHQRVKVALEMGIDTIPCHYVNLTRDKERELNIRLNKNTGEWDWDILAGAFDVDELIEWGFSEDELDFPDPPAVEGLTDEDAIPEVVDPITKPGDLWLLGNHRLLCGDATISTDVDRLMDGQKADMVFTDPPYNIGFKGTLGCTSKNGKIITMKEGYKVPNGQHNDISNDNKNTSEFNQFICLVLDSIKKYCVGGWYICFASKTLNELLTPLVEKEMKWKSLIIWNKNQSPMGVGHFRKKYEPIAYGYFNNFFYGKEYAEDDVWNINRTVKNDLHPTMKPIDLITKAIGYSSNSNGIVLDLFLGSGSTLIACEKTNRKCYGMELDPHYCDVIVKRWEDFTGKKAELAN